MTVLLVAGCTRWDRGQPPATGEPSAIAEPAATVAPPGPSVPLQPGAPPAPADLGPGVHELRIDGDAAIVVLPPRPNGRLVLYAHGYDGTAAALLGDGGIGPLADGLVAAGYAVAASDASGDAWGSAASVDAHAALAAAVTGLVDPAAVFLVAESMGGLAAARLVEGRRIEGLRAYAGIYPLCDLGSVYGDFTESIDAAYGASVDAALEELSPVPLDAAVPVLFWASEEDLTVDKSRNADVCAAQVVADGGSAVVVETDGRHLDPSNFDLEAMLRFFESAAR